MRIRGVSLSRFSIQRRKRARLGSFQLLSADFCLAWDRRRDRRVLRASPPVAQNELAHGHNDPHVVRPPRG